MSQFLYNAPNAEDRLTPAAALRVEVVADFVCPFSYIGKRHLDTALDAVGGPSEVAWYPFQLNPDLPAGGTPFDSYIDSRFGSRAKVQPVLDKLIADGRDAGIDFDFDRIERVPNTTAAHQLMYIAALDGIDQTPLAESLFEAYFVRGLDIGDTDVLSRIAVRHGISTERLLASLADTSTREFVQKREAEVRASGLTGVPGVLLNRRLLVVGAQSTDTLVGAFDRAMFGEGTDAPTSPALH